MLTSFADLLTRCTQGYITQRHFTVQQDAATNAISSTISSQLIGPILKVENPLPPGVTGYRLVSGSLISSVSSATMYVVKKHIFGRFDYTASGPGTYTYYSNPVTNMYSGNVNNIKQLSLFINVGQTVTGSSTILTINYNDPANQTTTISMANTNAKSTCYNFGTINGTVTDVTSVARTSGTATAGGYLEFLTLEFLAVFQNLPNATTNIFSFNNLTLTPTPPLINPDEELYLYCIANQSAKGVRGSLTLIGEN